MDFLWGLSWSSVLLCPLWYNPTNIFLSIMAIKELFSINGLNLSLHDVLHCFVSPFTLITSTILSYYWHNIFLTFNHVIPIYCCTRIVDIGKGKPSLGCWKITWEVHKECLPVVFYAQLDVVRGRISIYLHLVFPRKVVAAVVLNTSQLFAPGTRGVPLSFFRLTFFSLDCLSGRSCVGLLMPGPVACSPWAIQVEWTFHWELFDVAIASRLTTTSFRQHRLQARTMIINC